MLSKKNNFYIFIFLSLLSLNTIYITAQSSNKSLTLQNERWVRQQIEKGEDADLENKEISADFLSTLLKNLTKQNNIPAYGISIKNAVITGDLYLNNVEVPYETWLENCTFQGAVNLYQVSFQKSLSLQGSTFMHSLNLQRSAVAGNLWANEIKIKNNQNAVNPALSFEALKVGDTLVLSKAIFDRGGTFFRMRVEGDVFADEIQFLNEVEDINFDGIKVNGTSSFYKGVFKGPFILSNATIGQLECSEAQFIHKNANFYSIKVSQHANFIKTSFDGAANFGSINVTKDFDATEAQFRSSLDTIEFFSAKIEGNAIFDRAFFNGGLSLVKTDIGGNLQFSATKATSTYLEKSFNGMKVDAALFDNSELSSPYYFSGVNYRLIFGDSEEKLLTLINNSGYNADSYTNLEAYFRRIGNQDAADNVHIHSRLRERDENYQKAPFLGIPNYLWNSFLYITVGYGKRLSRALLWSVLLIVIGWLIFFRKEEYMMTQKAEDAESYKGRYHPLWYSIALFLPIVQLEDAKIWTPKLERRISRHYMRLHIILGYLLIPIGLAAWTGLIK